MTVGELIKELQTFKPELKEQKITYDFLRVDFFIILPSLSITPIVVP